MKFSKGRRPKQTPKQGSKAKVRAPINWYLIFGFAFLLTVLTILGIWGWRFNQLLEDNQSRPIDAVLLQGAIRYTSEQEIKQVLAETAAENFFQIDILAVQQAIEGLPWVYRASVRRVWPDQLKIYITEQQPIARWNGHQWLNIYGEIFSGHAPLDLPLMPSLSGDDAQVLHVWEAYKQLQELLMANGYQLHALDLNPRQAWRAELNNGVMLELGREDKVTRVQRFIDVYPQIEAQSQLESIAYVDLRYDTGLAVGWLTVEENR